MGCADSEVAHAAKLSRDAGAENAGSIYCAAPRRERKTRMKSGPVKREVEALLAEREATIEHEVPGAETAPTTFAPVLRPRGAFGREAPPRAKQRHNVVEASRVALRDDRTKVRLRCQRDRPPREAVH